MRELWQSLLIVSLISISGAQIAAKEEIISQQTQKGELEGINESSSPKVQNFGYYYTSNLFSQTDLGMDLGLTMDVGFNYKTPYYTESSYLILENDYEVIAGGKSWLTLMFYLAKFTFYFEANGINFETKLKAMYDLLTYADFCGAIDWVSDALTFSITARVDVKDCNLGYAGLLYWFLSLFDIYTYNTFWGDPIDCEWKNYVIDYPAFSAEIPNLGWSGSFFPEKCLTNKRFNYD